MALKQNDEVKCIAPNIPVSYNTELNEYTPIIYIFLTHAAFRGCFVCVCRFPMSYLNKPSRG